MSKRTTLAQAIKRCHEASAAKSLAAAAIADALPIGALVRVDRAWEGRVARHASGGCPFVYVEPNEPWNCPSADKADGLAFASLEDIEIVSLRPSPVRQPPPRIATPRLAAMQGELLDRAPARLNLTDRRG